MIVGREMDKPTATAKIKDLLKIRDRNFAIQSFIVETLSDEKVRKNMLSFDYLNSRLDLDKFLNPDSWVTRKMDENWHPTLNEKRGSLVYSQRIGKIDVEISADCLLTPPDDIGFCFNLYQIPWHKSSKFKGERYQLTSLSIEDMEWQPSKFEVLWERFFKI